MGSLPGNALQSRINIRKLGAVLWYWHTMPTPPPPGQGRTAFVWPGDLHVWGTDGEQKHVVLWALVFKQPNVRSLEFLNQLAFKYLRLGNNKNFWLKASCLSKMGVDFRVYCSALALSWPHFGLEIAFWSFHAQMMAKLSFGNLDWGLLKGRDPPTYSIFQEPRTSVPYMGIPNVADLAYCWDLIKLVLITYRICSLRLFGKP